MIRQPLQDSVGKDQVETIIRLPVLDVCLFERRSREPLPSLCKHPGRIVETAHSCCRITISDQFCAVAGTTANINTVVGGGGGGAPPPGPRRLRRPRRTDGRVRSSSNFRYCPAFQSVIVNSFYSVPVRHQVLMVEALSVEPDQDPKATRHGWILQGQ
jgi:hypothetical protein